MAKLTRWAASAGGAACKAARPAWGAEGSNGRQAICAWSGGVSLKKNKVCERMH